MPETPFISVLLPVYNGERYLRESIESVLSQSYSNFEVLVWDDCSTDSSAEIIASYKSAKIRRFTNVENLGLFLTLNLMIGKAEGEWIRLWSQDDRMKPECLEEEAAFAQRHPEVSMIYCAVDSINENGEITLPAPFDPTPEIISPELAAEIMFFYGSIAGNIANVTIRRQALAEVGLFREDMKISADFEMWVRLSDRSPIGHIVKPLIELRNHKEQFSRAKGSYAISIEEDQFIYKALMRRLPAAQQDYSKKYHRWHRGTMYWHHMVRCLLARDFQNASRAHRVVKALTTNRLCLAIFWFFSANQRLYRVKPFRNSITTVRAVDGQNASLGSKDSPICPT